MLSRQRLNMNTPVLTIDERSNIESGSWFSQALAAAARGHPRARRRCAASPTARTLSARGTPAEEWCGVAKGAVRVSSVSLSGKQVTLTYVEPGIWFGDIALFDGLPRTHDANAHGETTLLVVRKADFKELLAQHVELYDALLRLNCRRLRLMFDLIEDLNTRPLARAPGQADAAAGAQLRRRSRARRSASACSWRRKTWRSCWAPRASASTRSSRASSAKARCASSRRGWWCCRSDKLLAHRRTLSAAVAPQPAEHETARWTPSPAPSPSPSSTPSTSARCSAYLAAHLPGFAGPLTVEQFKGGQSNPTYKLITPRARLRDAHQARARSAKLLPSAHAIEREFRVMTRAARHRCAGAAHAPAVRGRVGHRPRLLRHGVRARAACCGTSRCPA